MRIRAIFIAALLAVGVIAPAAGASADICYSVGVVLNGDAVVDEADCIES